MKRTARCAGLLVLFASCRPDLDDDPSKVTTPRILSVRAEPPEARPGEAVDLIALYTDGTTTAVPSLGWALCNARRPLAEPSPIDPSCLAGGAARTALEAGPRSRATLPREACRTFGPDRPLGRPGEPAGRPADPDSTGGFYQPGLVGGAGANEVLFEVRLRCGLPSATQEIVADLERRYRVNANPEIGAITLLRASSPETIAEGAVLHVARGEIARLRLGWAECVDPAAACGGAEHYVSYDAASRTIIDRRESIQVSWLATRGSFASPRTGRDESDPASSSDNDWSAPAEPGEGTLFFVVRDSRGGTTFRPVTVVID